MLETRIEWSDSLAAHLRELFRYRELLWQITRREIRVRYKQSLLGMIWAVLQPLSLMVVFTVFFSWFARMESEGIPYPLFSYAALLPWSFLASSLTSAVPSLIANSHIITRIYFPREIIPLASVLAALFDFLFAAGAFVLLMIWYGVAPTPRALFIFPLLVVQVAFAAGVSLLLSSFTVLYRDVRHVLPLLLQIWMFITPILYPASIVPGGWREAYFALNPMAVIVEGYRSAIILGAAPGAGRLLLAAVESAALLWAGYAYFKHLEKDFADIV